MPCKRLVFKDIKRARFESSTLQKYPNEDMQCSFPDRLNTYEKKASVCRQMLCSKPRYCAWNMVFFMNPYLPSLTGYKLSVDFPTALFLPAAHDKQLALGFTQQMAGTGAYAHLLISGTSQG